MAIVADIRLPYIEARDAALLEGAKPDCYTAADPHDSENGVEDPTLPSPKWTL
jgi:hypothetical protein